MKKDTLQLILMVNSKCMDTQVKVDKRKKAIFSFNVKPFQLIICFLLIGIACACENEQKTEKQETRNMSVQKTRITEKKETKKDENSGNKAQANFKPQIIAVEPSPEPYPDPYPYPEPDPFPFIEPVPYPEPQQAELLNENVDPILSYAEKMPEFPGGQTELFKFINANLQYPQLEKENGIQGNVYVRFVVTEEGEVKDPTILKSVAGSSNFDKEVIRVIKLMPKWIPGENEGKKVSVYFTMPVKFKLD